MAVSIADVKSKARTVLGIYFGCLRISGDIIEKEESSCAEEMTLKLNKLLASEKLVSELYKEQYTSQIKKYALYTPIGKRIPVVDKIETVQLDDSIQWHMKYSAEDLDKEGAEKYGFKGSVSTTMFYDGFMYVIGIDRTIEKFNYPRHARCLHTWLKGLLKQEKGWRVEEVRPSIFTGNILLYLLKEKPEEAGSEDMDNLNVVSARPFGISAWTSSYTDDSKKDDVKKNMNFLGGFMSKKCMQFYRCSLLNDSLALQNEQAMERIGKITDETLDFYDVNFFNIIGRFRRSRQIGKHLAEVYTLMPNIEKTENDYKNIEDKLKIVNEDGFGNALEEMLEGRLIKSGDVVFTRGVNEMLRQDVSEIRAQINYQILLLSAIITFIAVIVSAMI